MGAARKLMQEIDRTLKKVQEGLDQFDEIWAKVYDGDSAHQKEKLEGDLKKEIKKLQRHRDQIKTWVASNDVKDKTDLTEARRKIERQMEKFKECEKEMKTKAFSKEGLGRLQKVDPREKEKNERVDWLNEKVDELNSRDGEDHPIALQVEMHESEQETLLSSMGKKKEPPARVKELADINARYKKHVERLEQILRALDNETIQFEQVDDIKELLDDYMENNEDDEDGYYTDVDSIYMELLEILDNIEVHVPIVIEKPVAKAATTGAEPKKTKVEKDAEREKERLRLERERERASVQAARAQLTGQAKGLAQGGDSSVSEDSKAAAKAVLSSAMPAGDRAATVAPALATQTQKSTPKELAPAQPSSSSALSQRTSPAAPSLSVGASAIMTPRQDSDSESSQSVQPAPAAAAQAASGLSPTQPVQPSQPSAWGSRGEQNDDAKSVNLAGDSTANLLAATHTSPESLPAGFAPFSGTSMGPNMERINNSSLNFSADPPTSVANASTYLDILQACVHLGNTIPLVHDGIWGTPRCARRGPRPQNTPASYPVQRPSVLELPTMWENMKEVEDLFTAFYLAPGTNCQYFAARELKRRNWRYHKQLGAWFQRHQEPQESTDEYENGDYIYFDYKLADSREGWVFRMKQSFMFRYDQLESDLT